MASNPLRRQTFIENAMESYLYPTLMEGRSGEGEKMQCIEKLIIEEKKFLYFLFYLVSQLNKIL